MKDTATLKVLMIEDSPSDALLIQKNLKTALEPGFELTWVKRLDEALSLARGQAFDVCLLDLSLPDSSGIDTCSRIREAAPRLPVVVLTGIDDEAIGLDAIRRGVQDYLPKSVDGRSVARAIRFAVERKRAEETLSDLNANLELRVREQTAEIRKSNELLEQRIAQRTEQLSLANESLRQSRVAALNLAEDALAASKRAEQANAACSLEITERKQTQESLKRQAARFELLAHTANELLQTGKPQELVHSLCRKVMEHLDCQVFFNFLVDEEAGKLRLNASAGIPDEEAKRIEWLDYGAAVCGCAARDCARVVAEHIPSTPDPRTELVKSYGVTAYACHPIMAEGGKALGTLSFGARSRETFSDGDLSLMKAITDQVAVAMARVKNERELVLAKEEWVETFNVIPDHIAILDGNYKILRANKAMIGKLGISSDEVNGLTCHACVHDADNPISSCPHSLLLKDGKQHLAEIHEDNLGGDFLVSVTPLFDAQGKIKGSVHVARDITERKKREEELRMLNRTLRALSRSSQAMMRAEEEEAYLKEICSIITEDCGHAMVWIGFAEDNEAKSIRPNASAGFEQGYLDTLNLTWADVPRGMGPTGTAIRTGRMRMCTNMLTDPAFAPWRAEALKRGYASSIVFPLMHEGKAFGAITIYAKTPEAFQEEEIKLLSELAGDLTYGITTLRVRNAIVQAQNTLREERRLIDTVLQTTGGLIIGLDAQGSIMMFNHACEKATGYTFDEVRGKTLWEFLLVPEEADSVRSVFKGIIAGAIPAETENENYWVTKDGTRRYIRWANSAIKNNDGAVEMVIGTGIDITERKTMEEMLRVKGLELLTANRELDAFSYSVSHDLRAPLHVITGFSQLLLENYGDRFDDRGKEYINLLFSEVDRMGRLIGDILNLSRITRQEIRRVTVDMSALVSEIAGRLRAEQPDRPVEFVIEQNCNAHADEGLMRIVLENLLGNAWKFTKKRESARIEFGIADDEGRRGFFVRDNGAGFDMRGAQRLFTPFQRLHSRGEFEGTGIGLSLVKRVITRHGGEVWVRAREGEGARFYFTVG